MRMSSTCTFLCYSSQHTRLLEKVTPSRRWLMCCIVLSFSHLVAAKICKVFSSWAIIRLGCAPTIANAWRRARENLGEQSNKMKFTKYYNNWYTNWNGEVTNHYSICQSGWKTNSPWANAKRWQSFFCFWIFYICWDVCKNFDWKVSSIKYPKTKK